MKQKCHEYRGKRQSIPYTSSGRLREPSSGQLQLRTFLSRPEGVRLRELRLYHMKGSFNYNCPVLASQSNDQDLEL